MKKIIVSLMLAAVAVVITQANPAFSAEPKTDMSLVGQWEMTQNATDSAGSPCPFVPEAFMFYKDQTVAMSNTGDQSFPYKTSVTSEERQKIEKRVPVFKGKNLLLIMPSPNFEWTTTPMVYAYSVIKDELTLSLQGYSSAKFGRVKR